MMSELERDPRKADEYGDAGQLTKEEKQISFLNRYFVFRKTHNVNADKVGKLMRRRVDEGENEAAADVIERVEATETALDQQKDPPKRHIIRKIRAKTDDIKITIKPKE
jgi:hypothetical protein